MGIRSRGPLLRSQLLASGYTDDEVRRLRRRLVVVRRGAYVEPDDERLGTPEARHLLAVRAAAAQLGGGTVVSHVCRTVADLARVLPFEQAVVVADSALYLGWEEQAVVGEFDGRVKYGRLLRPGRSASDAVFEEKVREDALRQPGRGVVRWTWSELAPFDRVARGLRRSLGVG